MKSLKCDGNVDCYDGTDEVECDLCDSTTELACPGNSGDIGCIPIYWLCHHTVDCVDFDEYISPR